MNAATAMPWREPFEEEGEEEEEKEEENEDEEEDTEEGQMEEETEDGIEVCCTSLDQVHIVMDDSCMLEALDGERLCKLGHYKDAALCFERALNAESQEIELLVAIYSQLGNCHFCLKDYSKSFDWHKCALDLSCANKLQDHEASAWGSLGSSLRALGNYEKAMYCCERQLKLAKEMGNKGLEAKACYNLADVHRARAKLIGQFDNCDPGNYPTTAQEALGKAAQLYEENLKLSRDTGNRTAEGRAYGSLGNTHYLLGSFALAIDCHEKRLAIAKEFGDKIAERRAYMNLGNARIFLGEFHEAVEMFRKSLSLSMELGHKMEEAQACFSLGNAYMFLRDYKNAIEFYYRHLRIAKELFDLVGEGRVCQRLSSVFKETGDLAEALTFTDRLLEISKEIGDEAGQKMAIISLSELQDMIDSGNHPVGQLTDTASQPSEHASSVSSCKEVSEATCEISSSSLSAESDGADCSSVRGLLAEKGANDYTKTPRQQYQKEEIVTDLRARRKSMEKLDISVTPSKMRQLKHKKRAKEMKPSDRNTPGKGLSRAFGKSSNMPKATPKELDAAENFLELLSRSQSRRINEQRCSLALLKNPDRLKSNPISSINTSSSSSEPESFFDLLARSQSRRIDDQRCPSYLLDLDRSIVNPRESSSSTEDNKENSKPLTEVGVEDEFLNLVANVQGSRLHNQRASFLGLKADPQRSDATSVDPANRDTCKDGLYSMLLKQQNGRIEMQRSQPPTKLSSPTIPDDEDFMTLIQRVQSSRLDGQRYSAASQIALPTRPVPRQPELKPSRTKSDSEAKDYDAAPLLSKSRRSRFGSRK